MITPDRRSATLSFGIRLMGLDAQQQLIEKMVASLHPPAGVHAQLVGLPVLAARSGSAVADPWRRIETLLAGLAAVALVLLAAFRGDAAARSCRWCRSRSRRGWSALVMFALRIPLNPMSVTLGALVIAISTEFSVLLSERHRQELAAGYDTSRLCAAPTGAPVRPSLHPARPRSSASACWRSPTSAMLRDFGLVTLVDLRVSLLGVLAALPAAIVLAERGGARAFLPGRTRPRGGLRPAGRRARSGHGGPEPPSAPRGRSGGESRDPSAPVVRPPRYGRYVVVLVIAILIGITINTIKTKPTATAASTAG